MAMVGFKINTLAKELNMKSKDLIEVLAQNGFGTKGSSATLSDEEFGFLMDYLTRNHQTVDLNSYLSGETYIRVETEERLQKRLAAEKAAAEKAAAEKAAAEKAAAEKAAAEKKPEEKKRRGLFGLFNRHS